MLKSHSLKINRTSIAGLSSRLSHVTIERSYRDEAVDNNQIRAIVW